MFSSSIAMSNLFLKVSTVPALDYMLAEFVPLLYYPISEHIFTCIFPVSEFIIHSGKLIQRGWSKCQYWWWLIKLIVTENHKNLSNNLRHLVLLFCCFSFRRARVGSGRLRSSGRQPPLVTCPQHLPLPVVVCTYAKTHYVGHSVGCHGFSLI